MTYLLKSIHTPSGMITWPSQCPDRNPIGNLTRLDNDAKLVDTNQKGFAGCKLQRTMLLQNSPEQNTNSSHPFQFLLCLRDHCV